MLNLLQRLIVTNKTLKQVQGNTVRNLCGKRLDSKDFFR